LFLKIKTRKELSTKLIINSLSKYPDQKEILMSSNATFKVTDIKRVDYGVLKNSFEYYGEKKPISFEFEGKTYSQYENIPKKQKYKIQKMTMYEIEEL